MRKEDSRSVPRDAKKIFRKLGACSSTFFHILNREFGYQLDAEVQASAPLAGGIVQQGYQCGMLWGASLAVGAESYRRNDDPSQAIGVAIITTQNVMESFYDRTNSHDCLDITSCDWSNKFSLAKYMLTGKFLSCFNLADKWAPEAIQSATDGFYLEPTGLPHNSLSCATEVALKMGASEAESVMVAGFAGGLGLSGNACGALSAAIWMNTLAWSREENRKPGYKSPIAKETLEAFFRVTNYEILCDRISGRSFQTITDHAEFVESGGCKHLIDGLSRSDRE
jgi:hypothetical protein